MPRHSTTPRHAATPRPRTRATGSGRPPAPRHRASAGRTRPRTALVRAAGATVAAGAVLASGLAAAGPAPATPDAALAVLSAGEAPAAAGLLDRLQASREVRISRSESRTAARQQARRDAAREAAEAEAARKAAARKRAAARAEAAQAAANADPRAVAQALLPSYGFGADQFGCLDALWTKESGWNVYADNPTSSAYGIPQALPGSKMATAGPDWATDARTQIRWGLGYIAATYGTPCGAWSQSQAYGWY